MDSEDDVQHHRLTSSSQHSSQDNFVQPNITHLTEISAENTVGTSSTTDASSQTLHTDSSSVTQQSTANDHRTQNTLSPNSVLSARPLVNDSTSSSAAAAIFLDTAAAAAAAARFFPSHNITASDQQESLQQEQSVQTRTQPSANQRSIYYNRPSSTSTVPQSGVEFREAALETLQELHYLAQQAESSFTSPLYRLSRLRPASEVLQERQERFSQQNNLQILPQHGRDRLVLSNTSGQSAFNRRLPHSLFSNFAGAPSRIEATSRASPATYLTNLAKDKRQLHKKMMISSSSSTPNNSFISKKSKSSKIINEGLTCQDPIVAMYPFVNENDTPIPRKFDSADKCTHLQLSPNGLKVSYMGPGKQQTDAGAIRTSHPIPASCGVFYYEVKVISKGRDGFIGIGLCHGDMKLNRLPGWDLGSYAYHGDDGNSFDSNGQGNLYGPQFGAGDIIGCGIDLISNTCFYTKNGVNLGRVFENLPKNLYPCVGLQSRGEEVEANFGQQPFVYNIQHKRQEVLFNLKKDVIEKPLPYSKGKWAKYQFSQIQSYLIHYGYHETAIALSNEYLTDDNVEEKKSMNKQIHSMRNRQMIQNLVLDGYITDAIDKTNKLYPKVFENHEDLLFQLKIQEFVELLAGNDQRRYPTASRVQPDDGLDGHFNSMEIDDNSSLAMPRNGQMQKHVLTMMETDQPCSSKSLLKSQPTTYQYNGNGVNNGGNGSSSSASSSSLQQRQTDSTKMDVDYAMDVDHQNDASLPQHDLMSNNDNSMNGGENGANNGESDLFAMGVNDKMTKAITLGQELQEFRQKIGDKASQKGIDLMNDVFAMVAYPDVKDCPMSYLLDPCRREPISAALNSAILGIDNKAAHPSLSRMLHQSVKLCKLAARNGLSSSAFVNSHHFFHENENQKQIVDIINSPSSNKLESIVTNLGAAPNQLKSKMLSSIPRKSLRGSGESDLQSQQQESQPEKEVALRERKSSQSPSGQPLSTSSSSQSESLAGFTGASGNTTSPASMTSVQTAAALLATNTISAISQSVFAAQGSTSAGASSSESVATAPSSSQQTTEVRSPASSDTTHIRQDPSSAPSQQQQQYEGEQSQSSSNPQS